MSISFTIVDVFSKTQFKGNPLAIVDNTADILSETQMKIISRQFNLSETTFFSPPTVPSATYRLRSFLPDGREVFGAGHNILGVWWWLATAGFLDLSKPNSTDKSNGVEEFIFHQQLGDDVLPVKVMRIARDESSSGQTGSLDSPAEISISIRQISPNFYNFHPNPAELAQSFGLTAADIGLSQDVARNNSSKPLRPQVVSTSTTRHLLVPISSVSALNRASVQRDKLLQQLSIVDNKAYGLYLFTPMPSSPDSRGKNIYQARFFSPGMSAEDPATGSAAGPLSAYLYKHGHLDITGSVGKLTIQQGIKVGRECWINVTLSVTTIGDSEVLNMDLLGGGVKVASGEIALPSIDLHF